MGRTLQGALKYKSMSVKEAMTPINQVRKKAKGKVGLVVFVHGEFGGDR